MSSRVSSTDGLIIFRKKRLRMTKNSKTLRDLSQSLGDTSKMGNHCPNVEGRVPGQTQRTNLSWPTTPLPSPLPYLGESSERGSLPPSALLTLSPLHSCLHYFSSLSLLSSFMLITSGGFIISDVHIHYCIILPHFLLSLLSVLTLISPSERGEAENRYL